MDVSCSYPNCFFCGGYYGSNFGQPVCSTCHLFLYSDFFDHDARRFAGMISREAASESRESRFQKCDSEDSGNEESVAESFLTPHNANGDNNCDNPNEFPVKGANARLADRLVALSCKDHFDGYSSPCTFIVLPPEVLCTIFKHLDIHSLLAASQVCVHWKQVVDSLMPDEAWKQCIEKKWPLFSVRYPKFAKSFRWRSVLIRLMECSPCRRCFSENESTRGPQFQLPAVDNTTWRYRRLRSELKYITTDPPQGVELVPMDNQLRNFQASLAGPVGSPYEGGIFFLHVQLPEVYPMSPPRVRFLTRIFHPNISRHGDVGLDSLQSNWSLALTIVKVLISIQSLLADPYTPVCMEPEIGRLYDEQRSTFARIAQQWTWLYATMDLIPETTSRKLASRINNQMRIACT